MCQLSNGGKNKYRVLNRKQASKIIVHLSAKGVAASANDARQRSDPVLYPPTRTEYRTLGAQVPVLLATPVHMPACARKRTQVRRRSSSPVIQ
jgi:hypothetical protein